MFKAIISSGLLFNPLSIEPLLEENPTTETEKPTVQSIRLVPSDEDLSKEAASKDAIDIQIQCKKGKMRTCLLPFLKKEISEALLQTLKETLSKELLAQNTNFYLVNIPEQDVSKGNLVLVVKPVEVGKIAVLGNKWFSSSSIRRSLGVSPGDAISESDLLNNTAAINRNPFIHTDLILAKGERPGTTDIDVVAKDRFPARFYAGTDNTGSSFSGNERFFTGVNASLDCIAF